MSKESKDFAGRLAAALGAQHVIPLDNLPSQGPLDLLQLRADLASRLQSSGGRPTDPEWSVRRVIPFKREGWSDLERFAAQCEQDGRKVSPSQLAAILIERGLEDLKKAQGS